MEDILTMPEVKAKIKELGVSQAKMAVGMSVNKDNVNQVLNERRECPVRLYYKMLMFIKEKERELKKAAKK